MRILIRVKQGKKFYIALPTRLLVNRLSARIVIKAVNSSDKTQHLVLKGSDLERLFTEIRRQKKKHKGLELLDVHAKDGTIVKIKL